MPTLTTTLAENTSMEPCPLCLNNTKFNFHSERIAEDCCELWMSCDCGLTPFTEADRYEDVWGSLDQDNCKALLSDWNNLIVDYKPIYVDMPIHPYRRMMMCHMICEDLDHLHKVAQAIGIQRKWFQSKSSIPHYDICKSKRQQAIEEHGAVEVNNRRHYVNIMNRINPNRRKPRK